MSELLKLSDEDLEKKAYQAAFNGDVYFFEEAKNLNFFVNLAKNSGMCNIINEIFIITCFQEEIKLLDYFLTSPIWEPIFNKTSIIINGSHKACYENCLDTIKYLTNSPKLKSATDLHTYFITMACQIGNIEVINYILDNFSKKPSIQLCFINGTLLQNASSHGQLDVIKFFFNRPNTIPEGHKDIQKEELFQSAYRYNYLELLSYLIFDLDIKKNKLIKKFLKDEPNEMVAKMFEQRELNKSLNQELKNTNNQILKKAKL